MGTRLHIVVSDETVADIDAVRGDVPRSAWVRRLIMLELFGRGAVEQALGGQQKRGNAREAEERDVVNREPSKPAEQPERSVRSAREFRPYPKGG